MRAATVCAMAISIPLMAAAAWAQNNATVSERLGVLAQRANPEHAPAILIILASHELLKSIPLEDRVSGSSTSKPTISCVMEK